MFKAYYYLTKPGIIRGNALNTLAGFFLASQGIYDFKIFFITLIGVSLVVAAACVFNNILDAEIDAKMERTKNRAMASGKVSKPAAMAFGIVLLILGIFILALSTNHLALYAALVGFFVYVFLYTPLKRRSVWATEIGSISGATPPLAGYLAVTNNFDASALILFFIFVLWQMPHFYGVAMYRLNDYMAANIPVLPAVKGLYRTKQSTLFYILAFIFAASLLTIFSYTSYIYFGVMLFLGLAWFYLALKGFSASDDKKWAKQIFKFSLLVVLIFCVIIPIDSLFK